MDWGRVIKNTYPYSTQDDSRSLLIGGILKTSGNREMSHRRYWGFKEFR